MVTVQTKTKKTVMQRAALYIKNKKKLLKDILNTDHITEKELL